MSYNCWTLNQQQKNKNELTLKTKHSPVPKKLNLLPPLFRSSQSVDKKAPQT